MVMSERRLLRQTLRSGAVILDQAAEGLIVTQPGPVDQGIDQEPVGFRTAVVQLGVVRLGGWVGVLWGSRFAQALALAEEAAAKAGRSESICRHGATCPFAVCGIYLHLSSGSDHDTRVMAGRLD